MTTRQATMSEITAASELAAKIRKSIVTQEQSAALIRKWADKELGPCPLDDACNLEARNQVFGWGRN